MSALPRLRKIRIKLTDGRKLHSREIRVFNTLIAVAFIFTWKIFGPSR